MTPTDEIVRGFEDYELHVDLGTIVETGHRRGRRRKVAVALAGGVLVVAVAFGLISPSQQAQAFWSPVPVSADTYLTENAADLCTAHHAQLPDADLPLPPLRLIDQRGDAALALFAEQGANANGPTSRVSTCTLILVDGQWIAPGELPFDAFTLVGDVEVVSTSKVVIDQVDGVRVEAAVEDGFFHFWWPDPESFPGGTMLFIDQTGEIIDSTEIPAAEDG